MGSQRKLMQLSLTRMIVLLLANANTISAQNLPDQCAEYCGNLEVKFPFGMNANCSHGPEFTITCDDSASDPKAFLFGNNTVVTKISFDGELEILQYVARDCHNSSGAHLQQHITSLNLPFFTVSDSKNKLTAVGCDTLAVVEGYQRPGEERYRDSCKTSCDHSTIDSFDYNSCSGIGCCQASIPKGLKHVNVSLSSSFNKFTNVRGSPLCSYAFVGAESEFKFSNTTFQELNNKEMFPMVIDWSIGDLPCDEVLKLNKSLCKGNNSKCVDSKTRPGYICQCLPGYAGNPYIGCQAQIKPHHVQTKKIIMVAAVISVFGLFVTSLGIILWKKGYWQRKLSREKELRGLGLQTGLFTYRQIKVATNNFDPANKIGEGGFGSVYRGILLDNTIIAVKQLSSKSKQGNREFLTEIGMISGLQHSNLVRLYGCCVEGNELLLVYEYMENKSLAHVLFGPNENQLHLDWPTRQKICLGIAKGLAFLHDESTLKIVHRDIKPTNILLDKDLNPKISDFGLAKLHEGENTHISTRIAGTIGYMAPEYALRGYLTHKADVYSFGVVAIEIVAGKNNIRKQPNETYVCLLNWVNVLQQEGNLIQLIDTNLGSDFHKEEAIRMIKVGILCTNQSPRLRPTMSEIVSMLEGKTAVHELIRDPSMHGDDLRFIDLRDQFPHMIENSSNIDESQSSIHSSNFASPSASSKDLYSNISSSN